MGQPDFDQRFAEPGYAYGTEPNDFLRTVSAEFPPAGRILCLAEGQGRNAVFLAGLGHDVTAMDRSVPGLEKAQALAAERGVPLTTRRADLADFDLGEGAWDGIVAIFAHLPPPLRGQVHARVVRALRPGGVFVLEAYTPAQLQHSTGGPRAVDLLMTEAALREELTGLDLPIARELEREVTEGKYHTGVAAVVQVLGRKPAA